MYKFNYRKKYSILVLLLLLMTTLMIKMDIVLAKSGVPAYRTYSSIYLDGEPIYCDGFKIGDHNYFKLRDLARELKGTTNEFDVQWDNATKLIKIVGGMEYNGEADGSVVSSWYEEATPSATKILFNHKQVNLNGYKIKDNNYFKLRDLGELLGFEVKWIEEGDRIQIITSPPANAVRISSDLKLQGNKESKNFSRYGEIIQSYMMNNDDGTITIVDAGENILVENYDKNFNLLETRKLKFELPIFGGFYSGEKYNYIVLGQENREEIANREVIRVIKYDKKFKRINSLSIYGEESYTIEPFHAGSLRMEEKENTLVIHTARLRYTSADGLNHQSQLTIEIDTEKMKTTNFLGEFQGNHVSHSFDQYVKFDGKSLVLVDHGDAYPRSIVLNKKIGGLYNDYVETDLFKLPGAIGANYTGVSLGGFELSTNNYLISMNSIDHSGKGAYTHYKKEGLDKEERDILILSIPRNNLTEYNVKKIKLATYIGSKNKITTTPKLVKITEDKLMVLWQEILCGESMYLNKYGDVKYVFIDGNGEPMGDIQTLKYFNLSDCQPVVHKDKVVWYVNDELNNRTFYSMPIK